MEQVNEGRWKRVKAIKVGPNISLLMFTDDLMLFRRAFESQINWTRKVLEIFCNESGKRINYEKPSISFSKNTDMQTKRNVFHLDEIKEKKRVGNLHMSDTHRK